MDLGQRPLQTTTYQLEAIDGEFIFFHPTQEKILYSNESGALIWQLCDGERTVSQIIDLLEAAYPEAVQSVAAQVVEVLALFADEGVIVWKK